MFAGVVDEKLALDDAGRTKGIRLDDVRARFQESAMNIANHFGLSEGEQVSIVKQTFGRVFEAVSPDVRFRHAIGSYGRAHGSVDNRNAIFEDLLNWMFLGFRHRRVFHRA